MGLSLRCDVQDFLLTLVSLPKDNVEIKATGLVTKQK